MSSTSSIEWTDASWNPATGCDQVSPDCDHCWEQCVSQRVALFYKPNACNGHEIPLPELDGQVWQLYPRLSREAVEVQL
jgi:protein gp37